MKRNVIRWFLVAAAAALLFSFPTIGGAQTASSVQHKPKPPRSVRLYVFDCGVLHNSDMGRFNLKNEDVATTDMSMACFLIAHPKGNLIWDTGAIPDDSWTPTGTHGHAARHASGRTAARCGRGQDPSRTARGNRILAVRHQLSGAFALPLRSHRQRQSNSRAPRGSCRRSNATRCSAEKLSGTLQPSTFSALQNSKTIIIKTDEYDVFNDGTRDHQVRSRPHSGTSGVVREAGQDRRRGPVRRLVSLSGRDETGPRPDL